MKKAPGMQSASLSLEIQSAKKLQAPNIYKAMVGPKKEL